MHDIDSTRLETRGDQYEHSDYRELNSTNGGQGEAEFEFETPMSEADEEALAAELLGVSSEEELDQFFGKLFRKLKPALGGAAKFLRRNAGPLAGALKGLAQKALPFVGGALGTAIPIPGIGTAVGSALGGAAANLLEFETDEMELDEREFEMARRFVRLASQAVRQASRVPPRFNPTAAANFALRRSLQRMHRARRYHFRPVYRPCPPCPNDAAQRSGMDPTGNDPDAAGGDGREPSAAGSTGGAAGPSSGEFEFEEGEFEFEDGNEFERGNEFEKDHEFEGREFERASELEDAGEFENGTQLEGDYHETDQETSVRSRSHGSRSGRWVRRGRKIVLYGL